jgi:CheY-like chemotaxis protein
MRSDMVSSFPPPKSQANARRCRILLVDDDPTLLRALARMLLLLRPTWEISFADNGLHALTLLARQRFDALVTDLEMPELDGPGLLRAAAAAYPETARVVHSSHAGTARPDVVQLADAILTKPVPTEVLVTTLEDVMGTSSWGGRASAV